ncbi:MAG: aminotransferase class I/II-fold pyridoxal phosphate-dependent enzyme [Bacillota bacterium]|nr:aminotransferase class I/II-fold pyridoxal phosphate-dependent enzyme [Bacillota bacterium]
MSQLAQRRAPLFEGLRDYRAARIVRFDVPGHKSGRGTPELTEFLGQAALAADVNSSKPLDNLIHPTGIIREAEELAAAAFGAASALFMVGGTTSAVQAMIFSTLGPGDKIIMPRNVHRSAINALVLTGAIPVYVNPGIDAYLGIPLGMAVADVEAAIHLHPDAKAVLVNNPTYYGVAADLDSICRLAHRHGMLVLVDEAHGTHFYFGDDLPRPAMAVGADMAAVSMHKTGGSLTQSSILLLGSHTDAARVRQIVNLTQTTSASYLLMASLDIARKNLALHGRAIFRRSMAMADYARAEINRIPGYTAFARERTDGRAFYDFDRTKLSIHTRDIGLAGIEVYDLLRDEYDIQIEFGDLGNILAIISAGDRNLEIERLISALADIERCYRRSPAGMLEQEYVAPELVLPPRQAFFGRQETRPLRESLGQISAEFVMSYPPGIPIVAPGERITAQALETILYAQERGCYMTGTRDPELREIGIVVAQEVPDASPP